MNRTQRLLAGEVWFLPEADWRVIQKRLGPLYSQVKATGKHLHCHRDVRNGVAGIRIWADDTPATRRQPLLGAAERMDR